MDGDSARALFIATRPRFEVDGERRPRLEADLLCLECCEDEDGMSRLKAVFLNWDRRTESEGPGFVYFDDDILRLGREIVVRAGKGDTEDVIFRGVVMAIEGDFPELRPPEVTVFAEDRLQQLRMRSRTRFFERTSDAEIAGSIAGDHGLAGDALAEGPSHEEFLQVNESDLAFLRERARAVDARLGLSDNRLVFRPRRDTPSEPIRLTRQNQLLRFHVSADLAHQRVAVRVHGYSVADKQAIHESAGPEAVDSEASDRRRTGATILTALDANAAEDLHLEVPATAEEARTLAQALMRARARRFVCGRGVTDGTPKMHVGSRVDLVDLGPWFSGVYHIAEVRHTFDQVDGLRTHFRAERVDLGARS